MERKLQRISGKIKELSLKHGFTDCGIVPAVKLTEDAVKLREWLDQGMHAGMGYMENHFEKRSNPQLLVPGTKSVIVVLLNYYPDRQQQGENNFLVSKYAYGRDYHSVIKAMLKKLQKSIEDELVPFHGRIFIDSAPVLERALASLAGLGWIGKNANLISPKYGSFCFIGELMVDVELAYNESIIPDFCGSCSKCIDACPTHAIVRDRVIDSRKCISFWTIEHKGAINARLRGKFENRIFGCDICQDVCPWNRKVRPNEVEEFVPIPGLLAMERTDWIEFTEDRFNKIFGKSALLRAGYRGLKRNIEFLTK